jgi:hypothetical protein
MELMNQNRTTTAGYYFYQNIVQNCRAGFIGHTNATAQMRKVYVYNNLFYGYRQVGVSGTLHGSDRRVWNNIFMPAADVGMDLSARHDPPAEFELIDFNLYAQEPQAVVGLYSTNRWFRSLAAWQTNGFGFDAHSQVADPQVRNAAAGDFRLAESSPARGAGRVGGRASGEAINLGPYITGREAIGRLVAPAAPELLSAE